jgi:S-adenosylmethionine decarboxylase
MFSRYFKIWNLWTLLCLASLQGAEVYEFIGHHLIANYLDCDKEALRDLDQLEKIMEGAAKASGATILSSTKHIFPPDGLTMVILLSESHASIHTYPEYRACFIDFFTCGHSCDASKFEEMLAGYLKPQQASKQLFLRNADILKESFPMR